MQGRLCDCVDGKIQAFPWQDWESEFAAAKSINLRLLEWTLDQERLYENPLMTADGQKKIEALCKKNDILIPSLTGDCFMHAPFWKVEDCDLREKLKEDFKAIINCCGKVGIKIVTVPLVDGGSIDSLDQENSLVDFLLKQENQLKELNIKVMFECNFSPEILKTFISKFQSENFGINYDMGNSASLGFDPVEEFNAYGRYILNVHVKDRMLNGGTVALGEGSVNFTKVFSLLKTIKYDGNYILQTARSNEGQHLELISEYIKFIEDWIN